MRWGTRPKKGQLVKPGSSGIAGVVSLPLPGEVAVPVVEAAEGELEEPPPQPPSSSARSAASASRAGICRDFGTGGRMRARTAGEV